MVLEWFANYYKRDVTTQLYVWERPQRNPCFVCRFEHGSCILFCKKVEELLRKVIHSKKSCNQFWTAITLSAPNPLWRDSSTHTGFLKKDARLSKLKNIPDLLSGEEEGKIMEYILAIGHLLWETLYFRRCIHEPLKVKKEQQVY